MSTEQQACITVSIVSHAQMHLVLPLLHDLEVVHRTTPLFVVLTLNTPENLPCAPEDLAFPLKVLHNTKPLGFGTNHNQAFLKGQTEFFCVLNPDIRISHDPYAALLNACSDVSVGLVAPHIHNSSGNLEDSARKFPTPWQIAQRVLARHHGLDHATDCRPLNPDWVGGMFMLLRTAVYRERGGFDERYFLYYEDVDLCARIRLSGLDILQLPLRGVVHDAQRASHRNPAHLRWHLRSMIRFFCSLVFLRLQWHRLLGRQLGRGNR